jgi:hypothetical protein
LYQPAPLLFQVAISPREQIEIFLLRTYTCGRRVYLAPERIETRRRLQSDVALRDQPSRLLGAQQTLRQLHLLTHERLLLRVPVEIRLESQNVDLCGPHWNPSECDT